MPLEPCVCKFPFNSISIRKGGYVLLAPKKDILPFGTMYYNTISSDNLGIVLVDGESGNKVKLFMGRKGTRTNVCFHPDTPIFKRLFMQSCHTIGNYAQMLASQMPDMVNYPDRTIPKKLLRDQESKYHSFYADSRTQVPVWGKIVLENSTVQQYPVSNEDLDAYRIWFMKMRGDPEYQDKLTAKVKQMNIDTRIGKKRTIDEMTSEPIVVTSTNGTEIMDNESDDDDDDDDDDDAPIASTRKRKSHHKKKKRRSHHHKKKKKRSHHKKNKQKCSTLELCDPDSTDEDEDGDITLPMITPNKMIRTEEPPRKRRKMSAQDYMGIGAVIEMITSFNIKKIRFNKIHRDHVDFEVPQEAIVYAIGLLQSVV